MKYVSVNAENPEAVWIIVCKMTLDTFTVNYYVNYDSSIVQCGSICELPQMLDYHLAYRKIEVK